VSTLTFRIWIAATPEAIWQAITSADWNGRYGYGVPAQYDLRPGGAYVARTPAEMVAMGAPDPMCDGEVIAVDEPRRLEQTWHALFGPETIAEAPQRLVWEIAEGRNGVCCVTLEHDVTDAPVTGMVTSGAVAEAGGGWMWVLSDLKSLLETGSAMPSQMG